MNKLYFNVFYFLRFSFQQYGRNLIGYYIENCNSQILI